MTVVNNAPRLGVGLGYREEMAKATLAHQADIDWLEIITDNLIRRSSPVALQQALELRERFSLVAHGLEMSVGSQEPLDPEYLRDVAGLAGTLDVPWFSDHLCFTREAGLELGALLPVDRTRSDAARIAAKAQQVQDAAQRLFLLENITYYIDVDCELDEPAFLRAIFDECECGLLFDVTNLWINSRNHGFDPRAYLDSAPVDRIVQVHLAGGFTDTEGSVIDSHSYPVPDEVWQLLADLHERTDLKAVMIERDDNFPEDFGELVSELETARSVLGWSNLAVAQPA